MFKKSDQLELIIIYPNRHKDKRGYFQETYSHKLYSELGIEVEFVQDNLSISHQKGVIRGLHYQSPPFAQGKLVRCGHGAIFDVAVDIREGSPTYGKWEGFELSAENGFQLYIPPGFAHGFLTLEPNSEINYKCSDYYKPKAEGSLYWGDKTIDIKWPVMGDPIISEKDANAPHLNNFVSPFRWQKCK